MSFSCVLAFLPQSVEIKKIKVTRCQQTDLSAGDQACLHHAFAIKFRFVSELHKESKISAGARAFSQRAIDITFHFVSLLWLFSISCPCFGPHQMEGKEPKVSIYPQRERATRRPKSPLGLVIFSCLCLGPHQVEEKEPKVSIYPERERERHKETKVSAVARVFSQRAFDMKFHFLSLLWSSPSGGKGKEGQHLPRERERERD